VRILLLYLLVFSNLMGQVVPAHKCGFTQVKRPTIAAKSAAGRGFDYLDESVLSPSGNFRIHFTRIGVNAVTGGEVVGTPNFVVEAGIAADSAYSVLVKNLGFLPPLSDNNIDGPELDIYIKNWGGSYYGMTYFENSAPSPTYLVIDNDYTEPNYATSGLHALRVTIAHEFFHMVQLRYAYPFEPVSSNAYWFEISSTWMEEKCYPEVNDYHAYVADNFSQSSFPNLNDVSFSYGFSYGHGLFGQVLDQEYGEASGKHIMLSIWENLNTREATDNLQQVLSSSPWHSSLTDALAKYALYNVFTGSRAIEGQYYADASELPEIKTKDYLLPSPFPVPYEFELTSMQMDFKKFSIQLLSDIFIRGENLTENQRVYLTYHSFDEGSSLKAAIGNAWIQCTNTSSQDFVILPMVNGDRDESSLFKLTFEGETLPLKDAIQSLWPNPSVLGEGSLQLNLMLNAPGEITLNVFDILGHQVYSQNQFSPEGVRIISLDLPQYMDAGIYFVQLIAGESVIGRKFTVLK